MQLKHCWIGILLLGSAAAQAADLEVTRVENAVRVNHVDGHSGPLQNRDPLIAGDLVVTGLQSHVSVRFAGGGSLLMGDEARLQVNSSLAPDPPGRATLARLKLIGGAVHVDARKTDQGAPADVHLAVGALQARLYGAEAWAEHSQAGDEICLVSGAAEIDTPGAHQRLDSPGECLRWTRAGAQRLTPAAVGSLLPRLAATNFSDDYATRYAAQQVLKEGQVQPTLAGSAESAAPHDEGAGTIVMTEVSPAESSAPQSLEWHIVLGTYADRSGAAHAVKQWQTRKLSTRIAVTKTNSGAAFEVQCGHYARREQAEQALARLRKRPGYEHAHIAQTSSSPAPSLSAAPTHAATVAEVAARSAKAPRAASTSWRISLGSFVDHANAERSVSRWKARGLTADIEPIRLKGRNAYRVLCGHYANREQAEAALNRLRKRAGYEEARVLTIPDALSKR